MCECVLSYVQLSVTPWTAVHQAPLSTEFSRQGYWKGLPFPTPGDLPDPRIKPVSLASPASAGRFFTTVMPRCISSLTCVFLRDAFKSSPEF